MEKNLEILTLNCWGIPGISKNKNPRMNAIAEELSRNNYDVVCLQEVWTNSDYNLITEKAKSKLPHCHYYHSGVFGSGLCILSKHPFQEVFFHQWPVNGYVHKLQHADWFGGKGVGLCRLKIGDFNVNIYSAHLHAEYNINSDEYLHHRVLQGFDTAQFIRLTASNADLVILAGDLNTEPEDIAYKILTSATGLLDAYTKAERRADGCCGTNELYTNSYTDTNLIEAQFKGKRIDYIMSYASSTAKVTFCSYRHPLPSRIPGTNYSYSDHEAVAATLKVSDTNQSPRHNSNLYYKSALLDCIKVCNDAMQRLNYHRRLYWFLTAFLFIMLFATIGMDAPFGYTKIYDVIRVLLTGFFLFTLIMATLWNNIECNAILAGKLQMEISFKQILKDEKDKKV